MGTTSANVNPTEIYNEGWMTRLLVYYSVQEELVFENIDFKNKYWTSEALISSPFVFAKTKHEGYTHADMALGDFTVDYNESGKIIVNDDAKVFGIIEAKMGSPLASKTSNAPNYNQASRNIVCIASNTGSECDIFFYILAPKAKVIKKSRGKVSMTEMVTKNRIKQEIEERFELHNKHNISIRNEEEIKKQADRCTVGIITYEDWIEKFKGKKFYDYLIEFYTHCKSYNNIK